MLDFLSTRGGKPASSFAFLAVLGISVFALSAFAPAAGADTNTLVSRPLGSAQNGASTGLVWDRNGRYGVFISSARNLVENQDTDGLQVFFHDRVTRSGTARRVDLGGLAGVGREIGRAHV